MLYLQDRLLLIIKNNHLKGFKFVDLHLTKTTFKLINFFVLKGYVLSFTKLNPTCVRVYLNLSKSSPLLSLKGNLSKKRTQTLSTKNLVKKHKQGGNGVFLGPSGLIDLSQSLHFLKFGSVRPVFFNR